MSELIGTRDLRTKRWGVLIGWDGRAGLSAITLARPLWWVVSVGSARSPRGLCHRLLIPFIALPDLVRLSFSWVGFTYKAVLVLFFSPFFFPCVSLCVFIVIVLV